MNHEQKNLIDIDPNPAGSESIGTIIQGYKAYQILKAVIELSLFDFLDQSGLSSLEEISIATNINTRYIHSLLQTLVELGLLIKLDHRYCNSELAGQFLVKSSSNYQGDIIRMVEESGKWNNLQERLTRSGTKKRYDNTGIGWDTIKSLSQRSLQGELQAVSQAIVKWKGFPQADSVLDIGGGHGLYTISLCQVNPSLKGLVFEQAHVTDLTKKFISRYHLENRVKVQAGDIAEDTPTGRHDIVLVSHFLYKFSQDLPSMLNKISSCLKPGGLLASNHWFIQTNDTSSIIEQMGLYELDKSLNSPGHNICPLEEFAVQLNRAGFSVFKILDIPSSFDGSKLHMAVKNA